MTSNSSLSDVTTKHRFLMISEEKISSREDSQDPDTTKFSTNLAPRTHFSSFYKTVELLLGYVAYGSLIFHYNVLLVNTVQIHWLKDK